jgi:hypothetical protein
MIVNDERTQAILDFLEAFETVFGSDWRFTKEMLGIHDETPEQAAAAAAMGLENIPIIAAAGTFLDPGVDDETSDWGNRGALLHHYRRLKILFC